MNNSPGPPVVRWVPDPSASAVCVYACRDHDDIPGLSNRIAVLPADITSFEDSDHPDGWRYSYFVTSIDDLFHESSFVVNLTDVGDSRGRTPLPVATLHGVYPNPFNPVTEVSFTLLRPVEVLLQVFDLAGRRVATLVDGALPAGRHDIAYEPEQLASGCYVVSLRAGSDVQTRKLMLVR